ncbi:Periplasmic protease [Lactobacillus equicursoris DSM 19284 = JCM 14600 = CIP 110162]|uniref:Periplasmic protease n=1 Tax=Lactobacillus equicursoris DSM 19284 = JCM 14600 = CIP 110162 TaxID=1293597 RepID=K0NJ21_9LACO|nr:DUF5776 domain-containing protein [Lactobacillus equicursoris]KRL01470.1 periplasmic protease [Lactobacillus equicursoris DSM 19284 = JCM 14600 = CIP 110162]CCK85177.1 Periplasmic protease [Lactobacillus equicursoris DSM 19284 = JCM 14600 = CIP 110162]
MNKRHFQLAVALLASLALSASPVLADSQTNQANAAATQQATTTDQAKADQNKTDQASSQSSSASQSSQTDQKTTKPETKVVKINLKNYLSQKPTVVQLKKTVTLYKNSALTKKAQTASKGTHYLVSKLTKNKDGVPVLKLHNGKYVAAKKSDLAAVKPYQNPKQYHQIHYTRVKPYGKVGYTVKRGYEGIKTYLIMKRLGTYNGYNMYNTATWYAVRNFQARNHLKVTGNVDQATWTKLGLGKKLFKQIDSYTAPLGAQAWQGRNAHIEAMIRHAYKYLGHPYLVGSSSMTRYGTDCSGLVIQSLYAGGISPVPVSAIGHAHPGNEWNSRNLWADKKLKWVPYSRRRRGDLVFYYQPGTRTIWHVAIYLGNNMVIESWPPRIMVQPISNSQRNVIAGIKRPFI